ncbi:hypothetical protein GC175_04700 [bacterium]|nr:hypothetical protein [bacterium]
MEVLDNQLRENNPPETKETYERLLAEGHSVAQARELIASIILTEIYEVLKQNQPFNQERFVVALKQLPRLPWE